MLKSKNTYKYGVRRYTVNIIVSMQVNVDGFSEKTFSATFKFFNYYHFVKGEKEEYFINKIGFSIPAVEFHKIRFLIRNKIL